MTETNNKRFKKAKRDEYILIQWSVGFLLLVLVASIMDLYYISVQMLAGVSLGLMAAAVVLKFIRKILQSRAARGIPISSPI